MINYKGYVATVEFDSEAEVFHGEVVNTRDVITFQSADAKQLKQELVESVEFYINHCNTVGKAPDKPFSGEFTFRTTSSNHRLYATAAKVAGASLTKWADVQLNKAARELLRI